MVETLSEICIRPAFPATSLYCRQVRQLQQPEGDYFRLNRIRGPVNENHAPNALPLYPGPQVRPRDQLSQRKIPPRWAR